MGKLVSCPDCGNEVSKSAQSCPKCGSPIRGHVKTMSTGKAAAIVACLLIPVIGLVAWFSGPIDQGTDGTVPARAPEPPTVSVGDAVRVGPTGSRIMLAIDDAAMDEMVTLQNARDPVGLDGLVRDGRAFAVDGQTPAKVIDLAGFNLRVRIADGEHSGKAGWVQREMVGP